MVCGHSFKCHKCGKHIQFTGSKLAAVRKHYWKHHPISMKKALKRARRASKKVYGYMQRAGKHARRMQRYDPFYGKF